MGIPATTVTSDTWNSDLGKVCSIPLFLLVFTCGQRILDGRYQAIFASPEMALDHPGFNRVLHNESLAGRFQAMMIDESHYISQWGSDF
jgi:hypothetical protein